MAANGGAQLRTVQCSAPYRPLAKISSGILSLDFRARKISPIFRTYIFPELILFPNLYFLRGDPRLGARSAPRKFFEGFYHIPLKMYSKSMISELIFFRTYIFPNLYCLVADPPLFRQADSLTFPNLYFPNLYFPNLFSRAACRDGCGQVKGGKGECKSE